MIKSEKVGEMIELIVSTVKILASYVDLFKDTFLACTLLVVVGGPASVIGYPTQFTSVIVMVMWATIIGPLMASTVHLAIYDPFFLFRFDVSRAAMVLLCFSCWVINPIILRHRHEFARNRMKRMMRIGSGNDRVLFVRMIERTIKTHLVQFYKIELGMNYEYSFIKS